MSFVYVSFKHSRFTEWLSPLPCRCTVSWPIDFFHLRTVDEYCCETRIWSSRLSSFVTNGFCYMERERWSSCAQDRGEAIITHDCNFRQPNQKFQIFHNNFAESCQWLASVSNSNLWVPESTKIISGVCAKAFESDRIRFAPRRSQI